MSAQPQAMPPKRQKGAVAPDDDGGAGAAEPDLEWAAPRGGWCRDLCEFECCQPQALRQHWRLSFAVIGGAFVGIVVYCALNAYDITQQQQG